MHSQGIIYLGTFSTKSIVKDLSKNVKIPKYPSSKREIDLESVNNLVWAMPDDTLNLNTSLKL